MLSNEEMDLSNAINANFSQVPSAAKKRQMILIVGSDHSGKSRAFNASQLTLIQTLSNDETEINSWHNTESLFIELPEKVVQSATLLNVFIKQIKAHKYTHSLSAMVLCINVLWAMQQTPKPFVQYLKQLAHQLKTLCNHYPKNNLSLHFMFTHMDKIAGFCHSFDDTKGPWGYLFKPYINHASLLKQNSNNNDQLLKNLHSELLLKLHDTNDKLTRYLIREFPLQMESIGNLVNACVNHLSIDGVQTSGVYFTCAMQSNCAHDRLTSNISDTYQLSLKDQVPQSSLDIAYFIDGMIEQVLASRPLKAKRHTGINSKYAATFVSVVVLAVGTHHMMTHQQMSTAYQELSAYQNSQKDSFDDLLPALEHLSKANESLNSMQGTLSLKHINALGQQINKQYKNGLNETFLPRLGSQVADVLSQSKSPKDTYFALKAYIMLGDAKHMHKPYLQHWFSQFWKTHHLPNKERFAKLLNEALAEPYTPININNTLVQTNKSYLQALPSSFLYFQLIEEKLPNKFKKLTLEHFNQKELIIPAFYTKANVNTIYQTLLPTLSHEFQNDAFVINNDSQQRLNVFRNAYLDNYHAFWQRLATKIIPLKFDSYQTASKQFNELSAPTSSLENLFSTIQENTRAFTDPNNQAENLFNEKIASHFTSSNLLSMAQVKLLRPLFSNVAQYFQTLNNSTNKIQTAFDVSKKRFEHGEDDPISRLMALEKQLPTPLNSWTKSLATNAWSLLLQDTQVYINQQWQNVVYHQYSHGINGRFPFSNDQNNEVSADAFTDFFGHKGKLAQFFNRYLSPFIDTTTAQWHPKIKDDLQLPIHQNTIKELIRANVIKEMFFKYSNEKPSIKFTLHALSLEPIIQDLTIVMNGQKLTETQDSKRSLEFQWPGNLAERQTQLIINNISGEQATKTEDGYWSWFKLIKKSNLEPYGDDMTNFQVTMDINGVASKFLMITGTQMNPFIPGLLEHFTLPDKIA